MHGEKCQSPRQRREQRRLEIPDAGHVTPCIYLDDAARATGKIRCSDDSIVEILLLENTMVEECAEVEIPGCIKNKKR